MIKIPWYNIYSILPTLLHIQIFMTFTQKNQDPVPEWLETVACLFSAIRRSDE